MRRRGVGVGLAAGCALAGCKDFPAPPESQLDSVYECDQPQPCGIFGAPSGDPGRMPPVDYDPAQRCTLERLANAEPVLIHYNDGCEGMCYGRAILTRPDGTAIVQDYQEVFEGGVSFDGIRVGFEAWTDAQRCELEDTSYFSDCLANFDASCLRDSNWLMNCADLTGAPTCGL